MAEDDLKREQSRLKRAWLRQAQKAYLNLIWQHRLRLKSPATLGLMKGQKVWGRWVEEDRRLLLSEELFEHPWPAVLGILGHELAHQMVSDLAPRAEARSQPAHGPAFLGMGARLGLDPFYLRATVNLKDQCPRPWPDREADPLEDAGARALDKVRKLLALSGSPVEAEAQAAMNAAARLMARHNLDRLDAERFAPGGYEYRRLELGARRLDGRLGRLAHLLSRHFFVKTIFVPGYDPRTDTEGHDLELLGRPENTRLAEHVFHFLMERTERLWRDYHRAHRGGGLAARNSYILALLDGFNEKLDQAAAESGAPAAAGTDGGFSALVLARDQGLNDFYHGRHPRVTTARSGPRRVCADSDRAGRAAGRALNFNRPLENGSTRASGIQPLLAAPAEPSAASRPATARPVQGTLW